MVLSKAEKDILIKAKNICHNLRADKDTVLAIKGKAFDAELFLDNLIKDLK